MAESEAQASSVTAGTKPRYVGGYGAISKPSSSATASTDVGDDGYNCDDYDDGDSTEASDEAQEGVRTIEAVSMTWTKWGLIFAYLSVFLMAFTTSLEGQVTFSLSAFAVSSFNKHSLISTVYVVQGVVNAVIKPPMAKVADVFGRLEAFSVSIVFYVLGYVQMASSRNVETYASAQIFYSTGSTGLQILQQIFIADTSDLVNRALFSSLPDTPFLVTVWIGPVIGSAILATTTWRWGYGMWALILPVTFLPLAYSLFLNARKAKRLGLVPVSRRHHRGIRHSRHGTPPSRGFFRAGRKLLLDLDAVGIFLLSAAFALILIPLTLASRVDGGWRNGGIISMIALGVVFLVLFPICESHPRLAPHPLIPLNLLRSRTFCAGCGIGFFYFMVFYFSVQPYFYSYLLVVQKLPVATAGHVTQTFSFGSTVAAVLVSFAIRLTGRYKPFVVGGSVIYLVGVLMMLHWRTRDAELWQLFFGQATLGVGCGILHVPAQVGVQASTASHQQVAAATAVFLTLVEIGGAVGSAVSGAVWSRLIPVKLLAYLPAAARPDADAIYASVVKALSYPAGSPERAAIDRAYQETMSTLLSIAACACLPVILLSLVMENYKLGSMGKSVRGRVIGGGSSDGGSSSEPRDDEGLLSGRRRRPWAWDPRSWSWRGEPARADTNRREML